MTSEDYVNRLTDARREMTQLNKIDYTNCSRVEYRFVTCQNWTTHSSTHTHTQPIEANAILTIFKRIPVCFDNGYVRCLRWQLHSVKTKRNCSQFIDTIIIFHSDSCNSAVIYWSSTYAVEVRLHNMMIDELVYFHGFRVAFFCIYFSLRFVSCTLSYLFFFLRLRA